MIRLLLKEVCKIQVDNLDLAISGNGYFIVNDGTSDYYTRAGNFYLDQNGDIVNSDGLFLGRMMTKITIPTDAQSFSIGSDGKITLLMQTEH